MIYYRKVMSENKKIAGKAEDPREAALDELFADVGDESITVTELPSRGKFYGNFKGLEVSPLTYADEQKVLGIRDPNTDLITKLLSKTVKGVPAGDLLQMDKIYLLMKVRELSYGANYEFKITCPACESDISTELVLSEHLNMVQIPEDMEDPREIELPKLKVKAKIRFPRSDEELFFKDSETTEKNLYRFVISLNDNEDPIFISKAMKRLHIMDMKTLINSVVSTKYGVDPRFIFECPECDHSQTMAIPFDANFFSVS
jgi:hypothetical protein